MPEANAVVWSIVSLVAAMIVSFVLTPVIKSFAVKVGAMDVPTDGRRMHKVPVPRLGGLAIFLGFILSMLLFADINVQVQGMLLGSVVIVVLGVIDDITPLRAIVKFIIQILAALIAVYHGIIIQTLSNPNVFSDQLYVNLGIWAAPITVIWIVAITNSVNLIDGLDGLAVGVSTISSLAMLVIALMVADTNVAIIVATLAGASLGFLPYNLNPAKIFMGDTGATFLGYILATVSIMGLFKFYAIISFAVPLLIVALPLFDTAFAFCRRLFSGKNPMAPDRGHFHHRLIDMGFSQKQTVAILYTISAILGLTAVVLTYSGALRAMVLLIALCVVGVVGSRVVYNGNKNSNGNSGGENGKEEKTEQEAGLENKEE